LAFVLVLAAILARHLAGSAISMGILHAGFGFVAAAYSIALTERTLALAGDGQKALSTAILNATRLGGAALASFAAAAALKHRLLPGTWEFRGQSYTAYDGLVLVSAVISLFVLLALPLVRENPQKS